jgi:ABC-2 type transport system permease protein
MHLFRMYWLRTLKKPGAIFLWLLLPFVFMTIYTVTFGGEESFSVGLAIVDQDSSFVSRFVAGSMNQGPLENLVTPYPVATIDDVDKLFSRGKASAAVVIPDGFEARLFRGEPVTLTLYKNPRHTIAPQIAEGIVGGLATLGNGAASLFREPLAAVQEMIDTDRSPTADQIADLARTVYTLGDNAPNLGAIANIDVKVVEEKEKQPWEFNMAAMFFPGLVAFSLMSLSLALEYRFLFDRKRKVNHRIAMTPLRPANILLQQRLYSVAFLYVMALGTGLLGGAIWRIAPTGILTINLVAVALILFITGINGIVFGMSNSLKAVSAMSSVLLMVLMVFGGGFFPIEFFPGWVRTISEWIPTGMANAAFTRTLTGRDAGISIPLLYAYCGAFFALSVVVGRRRIV